jgi:glycosyltransferase involved in cell wall biosynthesis
VDELSIFFPAYNEEESVAATVESAIRAVEKLQVPRCELIVVDDGSTDATREVAGALARGDPRVRVVHHRRNRGYGAALKSGFAASRYEWIFWTDADGQFDVSDLETFLHYTDSYDAIVGYRAKRADNALRRLNTYLWNALVRSAFRLEIRDVDCAFKLMRRSCLERIPPLECEGALLSTELLVRLAQAGIPFKQLAVRHQPRRAGQASGASVKVVTKAFVELFQRRSAIGNARPAAPH